MGEVTDALRRAGREPERGPCEPEPKAPVAEVDPAPSAIPRSRDGSWRARAVLVEPPGSQADQFRHFALRVRRSLEDRSVRSVMITSPLQGEGKTLVACNLALALASMAGESRVALVDLDLHHPSVAAAMGITPRAGVEEVLLGETKLRAVRVRTDIPELDLYPVARSVPRAHEILARPAFPALIDDLSGQYATVVCDCPPALLVPDVELIAPHVGACLLVAKAGVTRRLPFREAVAMLPRDNLIGTFLNFSSLSRHARGYSSYGYGGDSGGPTSGGDSPDDSADRRLRVAEAIPREQLG